MKKHLISIFAATATLLLQANTPNFDMVGFATLEGGTTGGEGGETVYPTNFEELKRYAEEETTPYIIVINRDINTGITAYVDTTSGHISTQGAENTIASTYGEIIKLGSNKTLIGEDDKGFLNRIGISIQCKENIIIRNLRISLQDVPVDKSGENKIVAFRDGAEVLVGDPDCISMQADDESLPASQRITQHIWIDHCELYNFPKETEHKDRYDGLIDAKNDTRYVTISWCYFHDHSKACLSGKGNSDNFDRTCTWHHNYFENIKGSRLPLLRYGRHHYFNNYMKGCEDGLNVRIQSNAYVENCYFEDTKRPIFGKLSENGRATLVDNIFKNCSKLPPECTNIDGAKQETLKESEQFEATDFVPSDYYSYEAVLHSAEEIPNIVPLYAGVGKLGSSAVAIATPGKTAIKAFASNGKIRIEGGQGNLAKIYRANGITVEAKPIDAKTFTSKRLSKGIYVVNVTSPQGETLYTTKIKL